MNKFELMSFIDSRIRLAFKSFKSKEKVQFAKVDPNYTGGRPSLVFEGETTITTKKYPYLSSYTPVANDKVMIVKGVIVGKIV